eukprot:scaffold3990_cov284-Chaetoceros_neogracile.AAC.1
MRFRLELKVVERLIIDADLARQHGRVLYNDNWSTFVALANHLYENYSWTIVETITNRCSISQTIKGALVQCAPWCDKKQDMFINTHKAGLRPGQLMKRHVMGKK